MKSNRSNSKSARLAIAAGLALAGTLAAGIPAARAEHAEAGPHGMGPRPFYAERAGHRSGGRSQSMADHLLAAGEELKLSDAQRTQLKEIRRKSPSMLMPKRQAVMEAQMDFRDLLDQGNSSAPDLRRAHDAVQKARNELQNAAFDLRLQAREVLTTEQRQKLREAKGPGARRSRAMGRRGEAAMEPFDLGDAEFDDGYGDGGDE